MREGLARRDLRGEEHVPGGINFEKNPKTKAKPAFAKFGHIERSDQKRFREQLDNQQTSRKKEKPPAEKPNVVHLTPEQAARVLNLSDSHHLPKNETILLYTGAKLGFDAEGNAMLYGYAQDRSDVKQIMKDIERGFGNLTEQ